MESVDRRRPRRRGTRQIDRWWRAANYLSVGQIYLLDNPLLRTPLSRDDVKPRLLGHWGTTPGPELPLRPPQPGDQGARTVDDLRHRARPRRSRPGRQRLPRRHLHARSTPTSPRTPRACAGCSGSSPSPAASRRTSRPRHPAPSTRAANSATRSRTPTARRSTIPTCSSPPSSATARPRPARWRPAGTPTSSCNPANDGVVLPILHLNGYKIANPTVLDRIPQDELRSLMIGYGHNPYFFEVTDDDADGPCRTRIAGSRHCSTTVLDEIAGDQGQRRRPATNDGPAWPMIVFRTPKGWTGPAYIDGKKTTGSWRAHQVPLANARDTPEHLQVLADWLASYRAEELFDDDGRLDPNIAALAPQGAAADERQPARQRWAAAQGSAAARLPRLRRRRARPRRDDRRGHPGARAVADRGDPAQPRQLPDLRPRRDRVQPAAGGVRRRPTSSGTPSSSAPRSTSTWPAPAGWSRCCPSTSARAGWRATC